jgi:hypothetical protein
MREAEDEARQAVLSTMLEDISRRNAAGPTVDFIVATGDLAFSGKSAEYKLVAEFLDTMVASIGIPPDRVFCVPGNHDVQRERSKMCFAGARGTIRSEGDVYKFLRDDDDRTVLLRRQDDYRAFEACFLGGQDREYTEDRLGYVSKIEIDDLRIAIIGLNSSWLSEGGAEDEGRLLIGESQVRGAIDIARGHLPHVVLSLQHHPFDLLQRFDRRSVQRRVEEACDFVHCGHLHDPGVTEVIVEKSRCVTVAAGASFESRGFRNTFTTVDFDPLAGRIKVAFIEYNPQTSAYEYESRKVLEHRIEGTCNCTIEELADAIDAYCDDARPLSNYLSSLLLGYSSDVPIPSNRRMVFGNWQLMEGVSDGSFRIVAEAFREAGRAVRLLHGRRPLAEILDAHGDAIASFVLTLRRLSQETPAVKDYLKMQGDVRIRQHSLRKAEPLRHTIDLLLELIRTEDWDSARRLAERTIDVCEGTSRIEVARVFALCLARSTDQSDRVRAVELYREVMESEETRPTDWAALAILLTDIGSYDEAKTVIRGGIGRFPEQSHAFVEIGLRLVQASGDRGFRDWLGEVARGQQSE